MTLRDLDVALVTCHALPEPDPDAGPTLEALQAAGLRACLLAWDDPEVDWSRARLTVLRSAWNYPLHVREFLDWVDDAAAVSALWNPPAVVRWNHHKRYLVELARRGLAVVPTVVVARGSSVSLHEILGREGWPEAVVKPAISAASYRTLRILSGDREAGDAHLRRLVADADALVQRYLPSVEDYGERSLIWIDGAVTHAVRKAPRFTGEPETVSTTRVEISAAEERRAREAVAAAPGPLLYARIDLAPGVDGEPALMELELIEPSLFFTQHPAALAPFVAAVRRRVGAAS